MSDQPNDPTAPPSDPTVDAPAPESFDHAPEAASAPSAPPPPSIGTPTFGEQAPPAPPAPSAPKPTAYGQSPAYAAPPPPPPAANPYGGYAAAPPASAGYGQVSVGSLPYVEHHFGPVTTFGDRILPAIIDGLLNLIGLIPIFIGFIVMAASTGSSSYDEYGNYVAGETSGAGVGVGLLLIFLGFAAFLGIWVWNRILKMGRTGQSVGKKMFGQKLINATTGQPIGPGQSFVREVIHGLANQVVYLSYLWMLWDANRQTLGDMVAKSTVIKVPKA